MVADSVADMPQQLIADLQRRLDESIAQQVATADVLKVISRSGFDLQIVLDTLVESACKLCGARVGLLYLRGDEAFECNAIAGEDDAVANQLFKGRPIRAGRGTAAERVIMTGEVQTITDFFTDPDFDPKTRDVIRNAEALGSKLGKLRSALAVPMTRDAAVIGVIVIARSETGPFPPRQIELLRTFADQAVIAIENARLFDEVQAKTADLGESLQQQTATADVLRAISRSVFDLDTVLDTLISTAARLCGAGPSQIFRRDGDIYRYAASKMSVAPEYLQHEQAVAITAGRGTLIGRVALAKRAIVITDAWSDLEYEEKELARLGNVRAMLGVPLMRDGEPIGAFALARSEPIPFTERQIELVRTFADQAVIAIENARLFNETKEALERQTATAGILKVIASSPSDVQPVFEAIARSANTLIGGFSSTVFRFVDGIGHLKAFTPTTPAADKVLQATFPLPVTDFLPFQMAQAGQAMQIADTETLSNEILAISRARGFRSMLFAPMMNDGVSIGSIAVTRVQPGSFADNHVQLLQTFADQAVIAIENVRLFEQVQAKTRDLSESLQQQTATAEVLKAISRSAFDLESVLTTLTVSAKSLCGAASGVIYRREGNIYRYAASDMDVDPAYRAHEQQVAIQADRGTLIGRVALEKGAVQIADAWTDPEYEEKDEARLGNVRAMLGVPLMLSGEPIGAFALARREPTPFSRREVELVTTFADQAVIAIENARLFDEVQRRTRELSSSLDELRTAQDRLVQTEKLASLGQLTAGIAHEIKNPLNFVNNFSALSTELIDELNDTLKPVALDGKVREEVDELTRMLRGNLEKVVQHGKRADSIVKNMLLHSREGAGERRPADINAIIEESLNLAYHGARAEHAGFNVTLDRDLDPAAGLIDLYPQEMTRVFLNLISNGFYAATKRKEAGEESFEPTLRATTKSLGNKVEIRIRDNGTGIPPEVKEKMFNPFFTTKPAGEGTGLGLSMSHDIVVKQHGGKIEVDTTPGAFTEFIITLPRRAAAQPQEGGQN
jgi:two-component system, NtrC family, sensor kinase